MFERAPREEQPNLEPEEQRQITQDSSAPTDTEQGVIRDLVTDPTPERGSKESAELEAVMEVFRMKDQWAQALKHVDAIAKAMSARLGWTIEDWKVEKMLKEGLQQKVKRAREETKTSPPQRISPATTWQPPADWDQSAAA